MMENRNTWRKTFEAQCNIIYTYISVCIIILMFQGRIIDTIVKVSIAGIGSWIVLLKTWCVTVLIFS